MRTGNPDNKYDDPETYDPECNVLKKSYRCGKSWCVYKRKGNPENIYDVPYTYDPECNIPEKIRSGKL